MSVFVVENAEAELHDLLPFWVNGTLTGDEHARVAQALQGSATLRAEVDALTALRTRMQETPMPNSPGDLGLARLMRAIDAEQPRNVGMGWQKMGLIAASAAMVAILSSALTLSLMDRKSGGDAVYEQASGDDAATTLTVSFLPEASEAAISALLREKGLVIVDGPSAIGLYRIGMPYDTDPAEAALFLSAATDVIASVEQPE